MGRRVVFAWLVVVAVVGSGCGRRPPPAPPRQTQLTLTISRSTLPNGLRVVLVHDPDAAEVQVTMRYQVGAVDDPPDQAGIAHLVEHLMFQQVLGERSLFVRLQDTATFFNAFTSLDATTYIARADPSNLEELLSIDAVRLGFRCTTIDESAFVREREVVVNEVRLRQRADEVIAAIHDGVLPDAHPYRRIIAGTEASVAAITRDQACAFADAHYAPDNAVLVVSGPIERRQLEASLTKFLARVARRDGKPPAVVPRVTEARRGSARAPIADDALVVAWALPDDPLLRARVRAVARATIGAIDSSVRGRVVGAELGDRRAPMIAALIMLTDDDAMAKVKQSVETAIAETPDAFVGHGFQELRDIAFNTLKQSAIHDLFATLGDSANRDVVLAAELLAGRDPSNAIGEEIAGLGGMSRDQAAEIARDHLGVDRAIIVELAATERAARAKPTLRPPVHDVGQRQESPDVAAASRPMTGKLPQRKQTASRRTLRNGLDVVLLPSSGSPTVDVRLVFDAGTADEAPDKRGVALIAAYALGFDFRHLNDMLAFAEAGGTLDVDVGTDHTSFSATGMAMHLDYLLAGLRRHVREGRYRNAKTVVEALRREAKDSDDEGAVTDAWHEAVFGARHPYARAGLVRHVDIGITIADVEAFRATRYTPANATLVIAGKFDAALADRWIDFLFADWTGAAPMRTPSPSTMQPASIAIDSDEDVDQVGITIVLPATAGDRAARLIAAQMLDDIAHDVRHQLGAAYVLAASSYELRLATGYTIRGAVDAARVGDAVELLRSRITSLRSDPDAAARAFVTARKRVLRQLLSTTDVGALADRAEYELALGRDPIAASAIADVHAMTIDRMTAVVAGLDLDAAVVTMNGRPADVDRAFGVLGRTPKRYLADPDDTDDDPALPMWPSGADDDVRPSDIEDALTEQAPPRRFAFVVQPGYAIAASIGPLQGVDVTGYAISGGAGYRATTTATVGLRLGFESLDGTYDVGTEIRPDLRPFSLGGFSLGGFALAQIGGPVFGGFFVNYHRASITDDANPAATHVGVGLGGEVGIDIVKLGLHRLGAFARVETQIGADVVVPLFTLGASYRY